MSTISNTTCNECKIVKVSDFGVIVDLINKINFDYFLNKIVIINCNYK